MLRFKARRKSPALKPRGELTPSERRVIRIMDDAMQALRREVTRMQTRLADAVAHKSADQVANMISTEAWLDIQEPLQAELLAELLDAGSRVQLPPIRKAVMNFSFDRSRDESARWAANEAGQLIREISDGQREMVKDLISRAQLSGISPGDVAREIRNGIGLTSGQAQWVSNFYERNLTANIANGMSVAAATDKAQAAADRYQEQVHRYRANTIARTEIMRANSEGRKEAWGQGVEGGWIDPGAQKEWIAEADACEICEPLSGMRVPLNEEFPEGDPPAHPNCRCDLLLVDEVPQDIRDMTDEELDAEIQSLLSGDTEPGEVTALSPNDNSGLSQFMTLPPGESRAASFYAETYEGQSAVKQVLANRAAGLPDLQGIDLDGGAFQYMQQASRYADGASVYGRAQLQQDIIAAANQVGDDLAGARVTTSPLYRGMRVDDVGSLFREGDVIDLSMSSATPDARIAQLYARPDRYRTGSDGVVLEVRPGIRASDIDAGRMTGGQAGSREHLMIGNARVVEVRQETDFWIVVVESV